MRDPIAVFVYAKDPLSQAGMRAMLRDCPGLVVVDTGDIDRARVAVVVAEAMTPEVAQVIRAVQRDGVPRVVAVLLRVDEEAVVDAVSAGARAILRWSKADPPRLAAAIAQAARSDAGLPPELMARVLAVARSRESQDGDSGRACEPPRRLSERDVAVLKLVAQGYDTAEVANRLAYSESTIKGVLHGVMSRLEVRNRSHAVAVAVREGII